MWPGTTTVPKVSAATQKTGILLATQDAPGARDAILFSLFCLFPAERLLERAAGPVRVGGRPLDILILLIERAGEVVSHRDLTARVWQHVTVDPGSLRFHVAALRRLLGDGETSLRFVTNILGRGYCFVASVSRATLPEIPESRR